MSFVTPGKNPCKTSGGFPKDGDTLASHSKSRVVSIKKITTKDCSCYS